MVTVLTRADPSRVWPCTNHMAALIHLPQCLPRMVDRVAPCVVLRARIVHGHLISVWASLMVDHCRHELVFHHQSCPQLRVRRLTALAQFVLSLVIPVYCRSSLAATTTDFHPACLESVRQFCFQIASLCLAACLCQIWPTFQACLACF